MTTQPANEQKQVAAASHLVLQPTYRDPNGALYVHKDYQLVGAPWADELHIAPIRAHENFGEVESWAAYVNAYGSARFLTWSLEGLKAILDYHTPQGEPGRCNWVAECKFISSPEWSAWSRVVGRAIPQKEIVEFLEDHADDIIAPAATDLMGIVRNLKAHVSAGAQTEYRPDGTTNVIFTNDKTVHGKDGVLSLPDSISISIPVLKGHRNPEGKMVRYAMDVRVRAEVSNEARLSLRLTIPLTDRVLTSVFEDRLALAESLLNPSDGGKIYRMG